MTKLAKPRIETEAAIQAFEDYLSMGPDRSLRKLIEQYREQKQSNNGGGYKAGTRTGIPTVRLSTLAGWSKRHKWQARIAEIDAEQRILLHEDLMQQLADQRRPLVKALVRQCEVVVDMWEQVDARNIPIDSPRAFQQATQATATIAKLVLAMQGEPLPERVEHTGAGGGPINQVTFQGTPEEFARAMRALQADEPDLQQGAISSLVVEPPGQLPAAVDFDDEDDDNDSGSHA